MNLQEIDQFGTRGQVAVREWMAQYGDPREQIRESVCCNCGRSAVETDKVVWVAREGGLIFWWHFNHNGHDLL